MRLVFLSFEVKALTIAKGERTYAKMYASDRKNAMRFVPHTGDINTA